VLSARPLLAREAPAHKRVSAEFGGYVPAQGGRRVPTWMRWRGTASPAHAGRSRKITRFAILSVLRSLFRYGWTTFEQSKNGTPRRCCRHWNGAQLIPIRASCPHPRMREGLRPWPIQLQQKRWSARCAFARRYDWLSFRSPALYGWSSVSHFNLPQSVCCICNCPHCGSFGTPHESVLWQFCFLS